MNSIAYAIELLGTAAFAVSGALTAIKKNMDLFGVIALGLTTAVGGGIIRDIILGITPPCTFRNPVYAAVAVFMSLAAFITYIFRGKFSEKSGRIFNSLMLAADSVGLGAFSVSGVVSAVSAGERGLFLLVFVGVLTAVGGGAMRDIFARDMPYIFRKHVYAAASIAGSLAAALLWKAAGKDAAMLSGMCVVIVIRLLSAHFRWNLPRISEGDGE